MGEIVVQSETQSASISAVVIRCGCSDPDSHNGTRGKAFPCPTPRQVTDLGEIAHYESDEEKQAAWDRDEQPKADARIARANAEVE